jgi:hypothetical protein
MRRFPEVNDNTNKDLKMSLKTGLRPFADGRNGQVCIIVIIIIIIIICNWHLSC